MIETTESLASGIELAEMPHEESLIRVIGVGGGGSNAVNYIYSKAVEGVNCIALNTDAKALSQLAIPNKLPIGIHGSGAKPEVSRKAAEDHEEEIRRVMEGAEMVFITAGMGKGTGTGASPVVARIAKEMGILTIAVVTIPFKFEGRSFVLRAIDGLDELRKHVDSLLIIANEQIKSIYGNLKLSNAFNCANDVIATAINGITGAVTSTCGICTDMEDMRTTLTSGQNVMMGVGIGNGENRAILAIRNALDSPLLVNNDIKGGNRIILNYATSPDCEMTVEEMDIINDELKNRIGYYGDQIWGTMFDENLGEQLKVTIVVTGISSISNEKLEEMTLGNKLKAKQGPAIPSDATGTETSAQQAPAQPTQQAPTLQPGYAQQPESATPAPTAATATPQQVGVANIPAFCGNSPATQPGNASTLTITQPETVREREVSLNDFSDPDFFTKLEADTPNFSQAPTYQSTTFIGDASNPIVHNDFLNNNVD